MKNQKGQAGVMIVLLSTTFLAIAFLAVDIGNYYLAVQKLKKRTDAAALASWVLLYQLGSIEEDVETKAERLIQFNLPGFLKNVAPSVSAVKATMVVDVTATAEVETIFLRIIPGLSYFEFGATSRASASATAGMPKLET